MKKVIMTLGFAAATIMASSAQEVTPQTDTNIDPATTTTDPVTDDATITDQQTTYPDQAQQDAADLSQETTPPQSTEPAITEPTIDESADQSTDMMEETNTEIQDEPTQASTPNQEALEDDSQSDMSEEAQPQSSTSQDEQTQASVGVEDSQDDDSQEASNEPVQTITEADLPEEVTKAFDESEYSQATIENVYMLDEAAVDKLMDSQGAAAYGADATPDKVYQLQVKSEDKTNILYYDEQGDLISSTSI